MCEWENGRMGECVNGRMCECVNGRMCELLKKRWVIEIIKVSNSV